IAEKMYLSEGTVRNYLSALLEKLELRDIAID
ncbi:MAG: LuxR C-terminal-related transcriptional regulator, partial [Ligilactobacillus salivarius]